MKLNNFIEGLNILAKYLPLDEYSLRAEHDEFWVGEKKDLSEEDNKRLEELGWSYDDDADGYNATF